MELTVDQSSKGILGVNGNDLPVSLATLYATISDRFVLAI